MSIALRILARLLFYRPLVIVLLILVYLTTALLLATVESDKRGVVIAVMGAFAVGGMAAVLTERIGRYSFSAGSLGLPDHARVMRLAQGWFLVIFVGVPAAVAGIAGMAPLSALAVLCTATAVGIVLAMYGAWWFILIPFIARSISLGDWVGLPSVQAIATAISAWMMWKWAELPERAGRAGGLAPSLLADNTHERADRLEDRVGTQPPAEEAGQTLAIEALMLRVREDLEAGRNIASVLALGLGYTVATAWRAVLYGIGIAMFVLLVWHVVHGRRPEVLGYSIVTVVCCFALVGRLQGFLQRWIGTSMEQSILRLTPQWPEGRVIKRGVVQSTFLVQRGSIVVWVASSIVAASLGWIDKSSLLAGGLAVLGTSLAFSSAVCGVLARRRVREWHLSTVTIVLLMPAGILVVLYGGSLSSSHVLYGAALMLVPPVLAFAWYAMAPLRLPLNVDPRAIRPDLQAISMNGR